MNELLFSFSCFSVCLLNWSTILFDGQDTFIISKLGAPTNQPQIEPSANLHDLYVETCTCNNYALNIIAQKVTPLMDMQPLS